MDQQKCIFMDTHIYTKGREGDGEILRIVSLDLESVGGYYVSVVIFLVDMKNNKIICQGNKKQREEWKCGDLNDIGVEHEFSSLPNSEVHGEAEGRLSVAAL